MFSYLGTVIYTRIMLSSGDNSEAMRLVLGELEAANMDVAQWKDLMIRFGLGLFFMYLFLFLMHLNALKRKMTLQLSSREVFITKTFIQAFAILIGITILSMLIVILFGGKSAAISGFTYLLVPILLLTHRRHRNRQMKSLFDEI